MNQYVGQVSKYSTSWGETPDGGGYWQTAYAEACQNRLDELRATSNDAWRPTDAGSGPEDKECSGLHPE
jgi:hypothetical protein